MSLASSLYRSCSAARRYRVARLLHTVALRLRKHTKKLGAFGAWNKCLGHLLSLSRAHIESLTYSRMSAAVERCPDADCRKSLKVRCGVARLCMPPSQQHRWRQSSTKLASVLQTSPCHAHIVMGICMGPASMPLYVGQEPIWRACLLTDMAIVRVNTQSSCIGQSQWLRHAPLPHCCCFFAAADE